MVSKEVAKSFLEEFNSFFKGTAEAQINGNSNRLEITIGSRTLLVSLPEVVGNNKSKTLSLGDFLSTQGNPPLTITLSPGTYKIPKIQPQKFGQRDKCPGDDKNRKPS